ncbi:unnamed protein product [Amoebophrya sp. A120]|nr:unnamed protein product [Amoebophrya sp. A120]|eukprot:GSA120T00022122001.1
MIGALALPDIAVAIVLLLFVSSTSQEQTQSNDVLLAVASASTSIGSKTSTLDSNTPRYHYFFTLMAGTAQDYLLTSLTKDWGDGATGHEALASVKIAGTVATKAASYMMELANHAQKNAMELDRARRAVEKYVLGTDVDTISDADPFVKALDSPMIVTPQEYSTFQTPNGSTTALEEGRRMFGQSGLNTFLPPYLMLDAQKTPGLRPTEIPSGANVGAAPPGVIPLSTPADMDGHFLQMFDNALVASKHDGKEEILAKLS